MPYERDGDWRGLMEGYDLSKLRHCGVDVRIAASVVIRNPDLVSIGDHVAIGDFCYITTAITIGDYVHIAPHCTIIGGRRALCELRDFSAISAGCRLVCGSDDYLGSGLTNPTIPEAYHADLHFDPVILEKHVVLGTSCVVHPGVTFGEGAVVGSCSLITKSLPPWTVSKGVPARPFKERPRERILELEARLRMA
jgi:galactoside O-acetyltransferase